MSIVFYHAYMYVHIFIRYSVYVIDSLYLLAIVNYSVAGKLHLCRLSESSLVYLQTTGKLAVCSKTDKENYSAWRVNNFYTHNPHCHSVSFHQVVISHMSIICKHFYIFKRLNFATCLLKKVMILKLTS